ncbi:uncharacterized protein LOC129727689 [Wyeomyia smithii]|uniref:uncharacterized protein LOC129727689 n=1 Tax=Wyeomyia smithii TaxID=174621 RepID=UPI00246816AC|nr:uncharacterized protein LOC129727689 [Wyeomyia smithii]
MAEQVNVGSVPQLDQEFQSLLDSIDKLALTKAELYKVLAPLRWQMFRNCWVKRIKIFVLIATALIAIYYIPVLNWNASALGKLAMVQVLPYLDWRPLYRDRCLVKSLPWKWNSQGNRFYHQNELLAEDCHVCETINSIPSIKQLSFEYLNDNHLLRNVPIIVLDSHLKWAEGSWTNVTQFIKAIEPLLLSRPCNVHTNLLFKGYDVRESDSALVTMADILLRTKSNDSWFVHFRNCRLATIKRTRLLIERPYFYAPHLEMPYSTWFLLSSNYSTRSWKSLKLEGFVIVMQLKESLKVVLIPRGECYDICNKFEFELHEGQSLVFLTDLWLFKYLPSGTNTTAITFVSETFWK